MKDNQVGLSRLRLSSVLFFIAAISNTANASEKSVGFSVIKTASSAGAQEAMVVSTGSLFKRRHFFTLKWMQITLIGTF